MPPVVQNVDVSGGMPGCRFIPPRNSFVHGTGPSADYAKTVTFGIDAGRRDEWEVAAKQMWVEKYMLSNLK